MGQRQTTNNFFRKLQELKQHATYFIFVFNRQFHVVFHRVRHSKSAREEM